jgi:hypothetical protein
VADVNGPIAAVDVVKAALLASYDAHAAAVGTERGVAGIGALKAVRATVKPGEEYAFPFGWLIGVPDGTVVESGDGYMTTRSTVTAFIAERDPDPDALNAKLQCHLLALMRLFAWLASGDVTAHVTGYTGTPPYAPDDTTWVGSVGIEIEVTVTEDID